MVVSMERSEIKRTAGLSEPKNHWICFSKNLTLLRLKDGLHSIGPFPYERDMIGQYIKPGISEKVKTTIFRFPLLKERSVFQNNFR